ILLSISVNTFLQVSSGQDTTTSKIKATILIQPWPTSVKLQTTYQ
ncbi:20576_t:CDS:1, partial [Racocetra persica]